MPRRRPAFQPDDDYIRRVAPEAVEELTDQIRFPGRAVLLPMTVRAEKLLPGDPRRPWQNLAAERFFLGYPMWYSLAMVKLPPGEAQGKVRTRRAATEAIMSILEQKLGRRPNPAEVQQVDHMSQVEGALALGRDVFRMHLMSAWMVPEALADEAERARRALEGHIRAAGLIPQRLTFVAAEALRHLPPGGQIAAGTEPSYVFAEDVRSLLPAPGRQVAPPEDAVWLGRHERAGRDVYFSFRHGLDPVAERPTHAVILLLGEQGSGKTTLMRMMLIQRLLQGRSVLSLDPEGENNELVQALGGEVVPVHPPEDPETCILHPLTGESPEDFFAAARFFLAAAMGESFLTPAATAAVHQAVQALVTRYPHRQHFSLGEFRDALALTESPEGRTLAAGLAPYVRGGIWEGFFDRPRALLDPHLPPGTWRNFDLTHLREDTKQVVMAALGWFLHQAVTVGRQPMDIFVDEGWMMLRMAAFRDLLDELGRRGRKRDVSIVFVTHLPSDLARHATSLSLASSAFVGRLPPEAAEGLYRSFGLEDTHARHLAALTARLPRGVFLALPAAGRGHPFPVRVMPPPAWLERFEALKSRNAP